MVDAVRSIDHEAAITAQGAVMYIGLSSKLLADTVQPLLQQRFTPIDVRLPALNPPHLAYHVACLSPHPSCNVHLL